MKVHALAILLVTLPLTGCFGSDGEDVVPAVIEDKDPTKLTTGLGAIAGLLIDDRFRPIASGLVLLQELGRTATSNANGEFQFVDVKPGTYTLKTTAEGHEALPENVGVAAGQFSEIQIVARRVASNEGAIITQEYSVFIPCAADYVVNGGNFPCTLEINSDDGYASSFTTNLSSIENVTYVVTEMKANQATRFEVQIRTPNATGEGTDRFAVAQFEGDYVKIVNYVGQKNSEHEAVLSYGENVAFRTDSEITTLLFVDHEHRETFTGAWPANPGTPVWINPCCGVGATAGVKAKFVQSIFIGEPDIDIANYRVYN